MLAAATAVVECLLRLRGRLLAATAVVECLLLLWDNVCCCCGRVPAAEAVVIGWLLLIECL